MQSYDVYGFTQKHTQANNLQPQLLTAPWLKSLLGARRTEILYDLFANCIYVFLRGISGVFPNSSIHSLAM